VSGATRAKVEVSLAPDMRADAAAVAVLRRLLHVIRDNLAGALHGGDDEYLHQLRIAVRRTRMVQRQCAGVFPPLELPGFRSEFRWLQQITGQARDLDVYLGEFDALRRMLPEAMQPDLAPLRPVLLHSRLTAHAKMARALGSARGADLLADWDRLLESLVELPVDDRPAATAPIGALAGRRIRHAYRRIVARGEALELDSPAGDYHRLRKKGKDLRYLLELFGLALWDEEAVAPMIGSLKDLQDVLGRHQDREVQGAMLRAAAAEVATLRGGGRACLAMGVLVERLAADERVVRQEFRDRFARFSTKHQRAQVRESFR
jgi:CHAD domain-containing protein